MLSPEGTVIDRRQLPERRAEARELHPAMGTVDYIAMVLLVVGGLNWAMVGLFDIDLVASLFGVNTPFTRLVYVFFGAAAMYAIYLVARLSAKR